MHARGTFTYDVHTEEGGSWQKRDNSTGRLRELDIDKGERLQIHEIWRTSFKYGPLELTNDKCSRYPGFLQLLAPLVRALIFASLNAQRIIAAQIAAAPIMAYFLKGERRRWKIK